MTKIKRGENYFVDLNPTLGSEIDKTRPCLIISNDLNNEFSSTVSIIPITSKINKVYPFEVLIKNALKKESKLKADQIRTIDKRRLKNKIAELSQEEIKEMEKALLIHLGIN